MSYRKKTNIQFFTNWNWDNLIHEAYEIKHSASIDERQYHVLMDEAECEQASAIYGKLVKKAVIYRGPDTILENGIAYINAEPYLNALG